MDEPRNEHANTSGGAKSSFAAYGAALAAVAVAVVVRLVFEPFLGDRLPFITLFVAVVFAAWYGGRGPAVLAFLAGALGVAFFILEPRYSFAVQQIEYQVGLVLYCVVCIAVIVMFDCLDRARRRLEEKRIQLEKEIAARQVAEKELAEREELLRITLASIGDAVITTDATGNLTYLNAVAQQLTGWTQVECKGKPLTQVFNIVNEHTRQPVENPVEKVLREKRVVGLANHTILISRDGTERAIDDTAAPIRDSEGRVLGVVLVFHDISDRRQAEKALLASQLAEKERLTELAAVLDATPTPIWIAHDPECHCVTGNPASYQLLGLPHDTNVTAMPIDSIARTFQQYQDGKPLHPHQLPLQRAAASGVEVRDIELSMVFDDGHVRHVFGNAAPIKNADGSVRGSVAAFVDITSLKEATQALQHADRRKDEFLAMLGHELRNPLAPITNAVQLLELEEKHETKLHRQARTIIERQVGQLTRLVDDLLEVSRITTGRIHLQQERVGLNDIAERAVATSRPLIARCSHELTVSLSPQPIWLHADAARLEQAIVNLLTNAAKYTPDGGRISLSVQQDGDEAILRVRDTGVGIAPELRPHIFDLFTQAERSLDRSQGGLGIGLCLVQRLVEMHGGRVEVSSELGKGSEFVVRLPVMMTPITQPPSLPEVAAEPNRQSLRVLVVDDNMDAAQSLAMLLEASGHEVRSASDGLSAVEVALDFRPNIVLLDIGLPGVDGFEVAKRLRQVPDLKNIVLIAMTGYGQITDKLRSQEVGFDHHLVKPADFGKVQEILATVTEKA